MMVVAVNVGNIYLNESGSKFLVVVEKAKSPPFFVVAVSNFRQVIWSDILSPIEIQDEFPIPISEYNFKKWNPSVDLDAIRKGEF